MIRYDLGIFIDARHLVSVDRRTRKPTSLIERIETSAAQLLLSGSASHRVIVANCADVRQRQVADEFATDEGFRVIHVPETLSAARSGALGSVVLENVLAYEALRVLAVVADLDSIAALADVAHRASRALLAVSAEVLETSMGIDASVHLPLDVSVLYDAIDSTAARLLSTSAAEVGLAAFGTELGQVLPGFKASAYGFRTVRKMIEDLKPASIVVYQGNKVRAAPKPARPTSGRESTAASDDPAQAESVERSERPVNYESLAQRACAHLRSTHKSTVSALTSIMVDVVTSIGEDPTLVECARSQGLRIQVVQKGFSVAAKSYRKECGVWISDLVPFACSELDDWHVIRSMSKREDLRLFLGTGTPSGFEVERPLSQSDVYQANWYRKALQRMQPQLRLPEDPSAFGVIQRIIDSDQQPMTIEQFSSIASDGMSDAELRDATFVVRALVAAGVLTPATDTTWALADELINEDDVRAHLRSFVATRLDPIVGVVDDSALCDLVP